MAKILVILACEECDHCIPFKSPPPEGYCIDLEKEIVDIGKFHADCKLDDAKLEDEPCPHCTVKEE